MRVRAGVGWRPGVLNQVVVASDKDSPEGLTLIDGAVISPDIRREQRFAYHGFLIEHGVKAFVNVLILSGKGHPRSVFSKWTAAHHESFTNQT